MAKILYVGSHASDDPTRAGLVFVAANGAKDAGHEPSVALLADGVLLMKEAIAGSTIPVGFPPVKDLLATAISNGTPIHI